MQAVELAKQLFQNKEIRIYGTTERPLFIAADVGVILEIKNIRTSIAKFEDWKKEDVHNVYTPSGNQTMTALTESGLYSLVFKSKKQVAKDFEKWILTEVLPTIRKTGKYNIQDTIDTQKQRLEQLLEESTTEIGTLKEENKKLSVGYKPQITYHECDINEFTNNPCVYLFHLRDNDYKFGVSGEIDVRKTTHSRKFKKHNIELKLIKLWRCETMQIMKDTELKIKNLASQNSILVNKYEQREIISTDNISHIVERIDKYVTDQNFREITFMRIKERELDVIKIERENENLLLQIELFKLKNNISNSSVAIATHPNDRVAIVNDYTSACDNIASDSDDEVLKIDDANPPPDAQTTTIDWIKNNPPINHEQTSSYYKRYCDTANNKISIKDFNKKVSTQGFTHKKTPKYYVWTLDAQ